MAIEKTLVKQGSKIAKKAGKQIIPPLLAERIKAGTIVDTYVKNRLTTMGSGVPKITEIDLTPMRTKGLWKFGGKATRQSLINGRPLGGQILEFKGLVDTIAEKVSGFGSKVVANLKGI